MAEDLKLFIAGEWPRGDGADQTDLNPAHPEERVATGPMAGRAQLAEAVEHACRALPGWSLTPIHERARILLTAADLLDGRVGVVGAELTREEGKTLPATYASPPRGRADGSTAAAPAPIGAERS